MSSTEISVARKIHVLTAIFKFPAWPKLIVPFLLGQSIGVHFNQQLSISHGSLGLLFTVTGLLFILFVNDLADDRVDQIKKELFPSSSTKPLPSKLVKKRIWVLFTAILGIFATGSLVFSFFYSKRELLPAFGILSLFLVLAYSFPPIKLNYRGGGELFEALGVGIIFPWLHFYLQSGTLFSFNLIWLSGWFCFCMASAIASGLSDEASDKAGGKKTFTTFFGNDSSKIFIQLFYWMGALTWLSFFFFVAIYPHSSPNQNVFDFLFLPFFYLLVVNGLFLHFQNSKASTNNLIEIKKYKIALHQGMWWGATLLSILLLLT